MVVPGKFDVRRGRLRYKGDGDGKIGPRSHTFPLNEALWLFPNIWRHGDFNV